jgi:hypothetical protein
MNYWISGEVGESCKAGTSSDAYGYISGGMTISGNFGSEGVFFGETQGSLSSLCNGQDASFDAGILGSLK